MSLRSRFTVALTVMGAAVALILPVGSSYAIQAAPVQYRDHDQLSQDQNRYGGYRVNRYGYGNYFAGPEGYGGYPFGSAGAQEPQNEQRYKCRDVPESC